MMTYRDGILRGRLSMAAVMGLPSRGTVDAARPEPYAPPIPRIPGMPDDHPAVLSGAYR